MSGPGIFATLNTAVLGMYTQQTAMSVVSHNIANANTPGYSRQRADIVTTPPLPMQTLTQPNIPISFGTGSKIHDVERIRDKFLDLQYRQSNSKFSFWNEVNTQFQYIQQLINTPGSNGLRSYYDNFWKSAQQVSTTPTSVGAKSEFVQSAKELIDKVKSIYHSFDQMRMDYTHQMENETSNVNSILKSIADLNVKVRESSVLGNHPNDLLDKRDILLDKLSKLTPFNVTTLKDGEISLSISGSNVLSGQTYVPLKFRKINGKSSEDYISAKNVPLIFKRGKIGALFHLKNNVVVKYENMLNGFVLNLSDKVNTILNQSYDQNGNHGQSLFKIDLIPGQPTALFRITASNPPDGYVYDPNQKLKDIFNSLPENVVLKVNGAQININTSQDSLNSLVAKINQAHIGVEASLAPRGNLVIRATQSLSYDLLRYNDSNEKTSPINISDNGSGLLNVLGFNTKNGSVDLESYADKNQQTGIIVPSKNAALHISVNPAIISDSRRVATDFSPTFLPNSVIGIVGPTGSQGSGGIQMIADLKTSESNGVQSMDAFFGSLVSDMGVEGQNASAMFENANALVNQIQQDKKEVSSVSINDEMAQMLLYQNAYTASARVVTTVNSMIETLVNMVR